MGNARKRGTSGVGFGSKTEKSSYALVRLSLSRDYFLASTNEMVRKSNKVPCDVFITKISYQWTPLIHRSDGRA
jgi:hypothetical protein